MSGGRLVLFHALYETPSRSCCDHSLHSTACSNTLPPNTTTQPQPQPNNRRRAIGVPSLTAPPNKHDLLVARWCQPSLSVVEVRSGGACTLQTHPDRECKVWFAQ